jgi:hypothetical protein
VPVLVREYGVSDEAAFITALELDRHSPQQQPAHPNFAKSRRN